MVVEGGSHVLNHLTALNVKATNLDQCTRGCVVVGEELCHDCERLGGVDNVVISVVIVSAPSVRVVSAAVFVAYTVKGALIALALVKASNVARVGCQSCRSSQDQHQGRAYGVDGKLLTWHWPPTSPFHCSKIRND